MASIISERARSGYGAMIPGTDRLAWYFLRVSGISLIFLALGHLFITHYLNVPSETTFEFVANRWANPLWRTFDWVLLMMALWHGLIGLRYSIADYVRRAGWQAFAMAAIFVIGIVFTGLGSITIFTFNEEAMIRNDGPLADAFWIADILGGALFVFAIGTYLGAAAIAVWVARSLRAGNVPVYRGDIGQYAWVLHRATGIGVLFFLIIHIIDIMLIGLGPEVYDESVAVYGNLFLIPMEVALVGAVIYHTLNGIRIALIDFWEMGTRRERQLFWAALIGSALLTLPSAIIILVAEL